MLGEFDASQGMEGGYGVVRLDSGIYNFEVKSKEMILPNNGTNVFLEMNYKNSAPFLVILQATDPFGTVINNAIITLNTKTEKTTLGELAGFTALQEKLKSNSANEAEETNTTTEEKEI